MEVFKIGDFLLENGRIRLNKFYGERREIFAITLLL